MNKKIQQEYHKYPNLNPLKPHEKLFRNNNNSPIKTITID